MFPSLTKYAAALLSIVLLACAPTPTVQAPQGVGSNAASKASPAVDLPAVAPKVNLLSPADAYHLLSRASFGPSPASRLRLAKLSLSDWLEDQLHPPFKPGPTLADALFPYSQSFLPPLSLMDRYQQGGPLDVKTQTPAAKLGKKGFLKRKSTTNYRALLADVQMAKITQHVVSDYQIQEVMVDFWTNHFNIYARKGDIKLLVSQWLQEVIRPHALGPFERLLVATAQHPAMLIYLDNESSVREQKNKKRRRGLNENYARELLELHTLGVTGGYTQKDVRETALVLTGWGVQRPPKREFSFRFNKGQHDKSTKVVLDRVYRQGDKKEGLALLKALARHPATAQNLGRKLCARFVADAAPPACVKVAAEAYREHGGEIREVLRAIFLSPSFWSEDVRGKKFKTPLEFVVSSARALDASPDGGSELIKHLARMGEEPLMQRVPTGYAEAASGWINSAEMASRFRYASLFAAQRDVGVLFDWGPRLTQAKEANTLIQALNEVVLGSRASEETLQLIQEELHPIRNKTQRRRLGLALALSCPEFQAQ